MVSLDSRAMEEGTVEAFCQISRLLTLASPKIAPGKVTRDSSNPIAHTYSTRMIALLLLLLCKMRDVSNGVA